ncbi:hypothetical protein FRUB_09147 [Fimbriiglobus ruber]|uniref:Uncharacterized protein n=1 Tax=Fimbriiglobus ruber TaxID=1908690 RepID=A0A225DA94_9BACT|nr:hypothetical protein FRUB_09147 [Fimbriiglobus ruber]
MPEMIFGIIFKALRIRDLRHANMAGLKHELGIRVATNRC